MRSYPTDRPPYFAQRFIRLLTKTAAAMEIGADGAWLLSMIVSQEDAKRYTGPVTYWNEQLFSLMGCGSKKPLIKARQKCVDHGWLHYDEGMKGAPGKYWVTIPTRFEQLPDGNCDESVADLQVPNGTGNGTATGPLSNLYPNPKRERAKFVPPPLEEVTQYWLSHSLNGDPAAFHDYYTANGWRAGKTAIKDWQAAARGWSRRQLVFQSASQSQTHRPDLDLFVPEEDIA